MNYFYYKENITPNCCHRNFASSWLDKKWSQIHKLFTSCWSAAIHNLISLSKEKYNRLSRDVVTSKMDHDISTAFCWFSSGDEVHWAHVTYRLDGIPCLWLAHLRKVPLAVEFHPITAEHNSLWVTRITPHGVKPSIFSVIELHSAYRCSSFCQILKKCVYTVQNHLNLSKIKVALTCLCRFSERHILICHSWARQQDRSPPTLERSKVYWSRLTLVNQKSHGSYPHKTSPW